MVENALLKEMQVQPQAARAVIEDSSVRAHLKALAALVADRDQLWITGMGASHHAGEILASTLRNAGYAAWAIPTSELLYYGLSAIQAPLLVLSQSGESAEIVKLIGRLDRVDWWGLTLNEKSVLARKGAAVLPGGLETAFAASRSFTSTLTALLWLAGQLGALEDKFDQRVSLAIQSLSQALECGFDWIEPAVQHLYRCKALITSGRGPMVGLANAAALMYMEIGRQPCLALEGGQLRHGPIEMLDPDIGVILFRTSGETAVQMDRLVKIIRDAGSPAIVLDTIQKDDCFPYTSEAPFMLHVGCVAPMPEMAATLSFIALTQCLAFRLAESRNIEPGIPLRSNKVTREE